MSTSTSIPLAFRCTKCWQMTCADSDQVGDSIPCLSCSSPIVVPEATSKTIEAGEEFTAKSETQPPPQADLFTEMTPNEIVQTANEKVEEERRASGDPAVLVCSRWQRLLGSIIDSVAAVVSVMIGIGLAMALDTASGGEKSPLLFIVMVTVPLMLGMCQCFWIATEGRTLGKYCVKTKIVNHTCDPPGFLHGIILRIVVVGLLGMIPFFGLANACWIFNEPKRCLHDYIAGTWVIDA